MGVLRRRGAALLAVGALLLAAMPSSGAVAEPPAPGTYLGNGFDACSAPSSSTMDTWLASPYRAVGVYVGGVNRACAQPELTATWVAHQEASGWHLLPIYLGLQASCTTSNKRYLIDPAQAAAQGRSEATSAVAAATDLGLPRGSTLFFDMEAYQTGNAACTTEVLDFLGAWTSRLHDLGYLSGVYSSLGSGVADLVADYPSTAHPHPDYLWFARYDGTASTDNDTIPDAYWSPHRRLHQYRGGHDETYGGVSINIDNDYVDVRPLPGAGFGDFTGNGWSDLLARDRSTGTLYLRTPGTAPTWRPGSASAPAGSARPSGTATSTATGTRTWSPATSPPATCGCIPARERAWAGEAGSAPGGTRCARSPPSAT